jgi:hypothetical protein
MNRCIKLMMVTTVAIAWCPMQTQASDTDHPARVEAGANPAVTSYLQEIEC